MSGNLESPWLSGKGLRVVVVGVQYPDGECYMWYVVRVLRYNMLYLILGMFFAYIIAVSPSGATQTPVDRKTGKAAAHLIGS